MDIASVGAPGSHELVTSVHLGSNCQTVSCVPWCRSHQQIIRASASTAGYWPCRSLYHVRGLKTRRSCRNQEREKVGCSLDFSKPAIFLQFPILEATEAREKIKHSSTKQRLPWMTGASPSLNTRPPKESTFHNLNFVFSLLSAHWPPSPAARQLPFSPSITNPFSPHLSFLAIQIHVSFTPALSFSINHINADWRSFWRKTKIPANYMAVESLLVLWINLFFCFFFNLPLIIAQCESPCIIFS